MPSTEISSPHADAIEARTGLQPWLFFFVAAAFYCYEFFARVAPGVLKSDIRDVSGATEGQFGLAMGMYFLAYAPAQLIVGRMLDRFGTRVVVAPSAIFVALGCLLLASTDSIVVMGIGRFLQGLGSSVAYLGVVYLALVWFPPHRHGIIPGITVAMGTLGGCTAQYPLATMSEAYGWRIPLFVCGAVGIAIASLLWCLLPKRPSWFVNLMREDGYEPDLPEPMIPMILRIAGNRQLWLISLAAAGFYLPISVIGDLWGVTFLEIETGIGTTGASLATTLVFVGFAIGGVGVGHLADRWGRRKILFVGCSIASCVIAALLMLSAVEPTWLTIILLAALGVTTGGQSLAFVMTADFAARHTRGVQLAFVNFIVMILPVAVQPGVGYLAGIGVSANNLPSATQELRGYALVVGLMMAGTLIACFVRETKPQHDAGPKQH
jgi:MFS family permease